MEEYILKLLKELKEEIRLADQRIKQLELKANKGAANGYAELDANALLPLNRIPTTLTGKDADMVDGYHLNQSLLNTDSPNFAGINIEKNIVFFDSISNGLILYLPFEEGMGTTVNDKSKQGNNGIIHGATWTEGKVGKALSFDGVNDYVEVADSASLRIETDLTISAWIYPSNVAKGRQSIIFKHYNYEYEVIMEPMGVITFYHGDGNYEAMRAYEIEINQNQWNYIAITRSMSDMTVKFYLNGDFIVLKTFTLIPLASTYPVNIGIRTNTNFYFQGLIDEVRIYNRALNAAEIKELYDRGNIQGGILYEEAGKLVYRSSSKALTFLTDNE